MYESSGGLLVAVFKERKGDGESRKNCGKRSFFFVGGSVQIRTGDLYPAPCGRHKIRTCDLHNVNVTL